jgi:hypothetical protein
MLESAIAIIMMVTALASVLTSPPQSQDLSKINHKLRVYNALKIEDDVGDLRKNAVDNDADAIKAELQPYIPSTAGFGVAVYNSTANTTAVPAPSESSADVMTVGYLLAGWPGSYNPREVRVFLWGFE